MRALSSADLSLFSISSLRIVHFNLRGWLSHSAELESFLQHSEPRPDIVCLNETLLDKSVLDIQISGYACVSRRDRRDGRAGGGIAVFAIDGIADNIVHELDVDDHERCWHIIHSDQGPLLLGAWYRPPASGEVASIHALGPELAKLSESCVGTIIVGDLNVHNKDWLRFSSNNSKEGRELHAFCCSHGFSQHVCGPTRNDHLLDLVLSDLETVKVDIIPGFSDHEGLSIKIPFTTPETEFVERECFNFQKADWESMGKDILNTNWNELLEDLHVDDAVSVFTETLTEIVRRRIPARRMKTRKSTHPWLTARCAEALRAKRVAVGTPDFLAKRNECTQVFLEEYTKYVRKTKGELETLPSGSERWWKISNSLLMKAQGTSSVPALRRNDSSWATSPDDKAKVLQDTFSRKSQLPPAQPNEYTPGIFQAWLTSTPSRQAADVMDPLQIDRAKAEQILRKMRVDSGSGPDFVSTKVLRRCAVELSVPVALLCNKILAETKWPTPWKHHWVCPLHKKKSKADATNYRGVHLTSQVSKACERILSDLFQPHFEKAGLYGPRQFAYMKGRGHRDALLLNVLQWLLWLELGNIVGLYCSDVSGAFDRVCKELLGYKLRSSGLPSRIVAVLESWLDDRVAEVIVGGRAAAPSPLTNSVFQGTVWGPPLWNRHYASGRHAVNACGYSEVTYADDMNMSKPFPASTSSDAILEDAQECQRELHRWGHGNRVLFDPGKEEFHVIHRAHHRRDASIFKILGIEFDARLVMKHAAQELARQAAWRVKALLRVRKFYSRKDMVNMYKARVLSFVEAGSSSMLHASKSALSILDRVQNRFLRGVGLSAEDAFLMYNLAPLSSRRDIASLGVLYKCVLGTAPAPIASFFPLASPQQTSVQTRLQVSRHSKQLFDRVAANSTDVFKRSLFGRVRVFNRLPEVVIQSESVSAFQSSLAKAMRKAAASNRNWSNVFSTSQCVKDIRTFQQYFV